MQKKIIQTAFQHPYLSLTEKIVLPNSLFWETYFKQPSSTLLVHAGYRNIPTEQKWSIDGSIYIDSREFETGLIWDKNPDEDLERFYRKYQFGRYNRIMIYSTKGNMAACRFALLLLYMGVTQVNVLDGGLTACPNYDDIDATCEVKLLKEQSPVMQTRKEIFMTAKQAYAVCQAGNSQLVDIRSKQEHLGLISGYQDYHKKGRPSGSVYGGNIDSYITAEHKQGYFDYIINLWEQNSVDWQKKHLIFFCGTGWRAAEAFIYGLDYGLTNISVFSGIRDWIESSLPLEPL